MSEPHFSAADEAIEEIREARRKLWEQFGNDPARFTARMQEFHAESLKQGHREIKLPKGEAARISAGCEAMRRKRAAREQ